jgi:cell division protein FtsB
MIDDTGGHRTATIPRPKDPTRSGAAVGPGDVEREDRKLIRRRRTRVIMALGAAIVAGALAASVMILPIKAWLNQKEELSDRQRELRDLEQDNARLDDDVDRLETQAGVIEAARQELGLVGADEQVFRVTSNPELLSYLPEGWLYPPLSQILVGRGGLPEDPSLVSDDATDAGG